MSKLELVQIYWPPRRVSWDPAQILLLNEVNYGLSLLSLLGRKLSLLVSSQLGGSKPMHPHTQTNGEQSSGFN